MCVCVCFAIWKLFHQMVAVIWIRVAFYIKHKSFNDINESSHEKKKNSNLRTHHTRKWNIDIYLIETSGWTVNGCGERKGRSNRKNFIAAKCWNSNGFPPCFFFIISFKIPVVLASTPLLTVMSSRFSLSSSSICLRNNFFFSSQQNTKKKKINHQNHNKLLKNTRKRGNTIQKHSI